MGAVYEAYRNTIERLDLEGTIAPGWALDEAADLLWTMLSIRDWESLTMERDDQYVDRMQDLTRRVFVREPEDA